MPKAASRSRSGRRPRRRRRVPARRQPGRRRRCRWPRSRRAASWPGRCSPCASCSPTRPPTLVFDEVDAGIGGEPPWRSAGARPPSADEHQVLVVTHLPQVAAFADARSRWPSTSDEPRRCAGAAARRRRAGGRAVADAVGPARQRRRPQPRRRAAGHRRRRAGALRRAGRRRPRPRTVEGVGAVDRARPSADGRAVAPSATGRSPARPGRPPHQATGQAAAARRHRGDRPRGPRPGGGREPGRRRAGRGGQRRARRSPAGTRTWARCCLPAPASRWSTAWAPR